MSVHVYAPGLADDKEFPCEADANNWLSGHGYVRRQTQPGEWVQLRDDGNRFASVKRPDSAVWSPTTRGSST